METIDAIMQRRSIREYKKEPIPEDDLKKILECARQAPSAANRQPCRFIIVRDADLKQKVASACAEQMWMADADAILAGVGIPEQSGDWYPVDVAIAMQNLILAATDLGYGTCWIGAFDQNKIKLGFFNISFMLLLMLYLSSSLNENAPRRILKARFSS